MTREKIVEEKVQDNAVSAVIRLQPADDDVLLFKIATDDDGVPLCELDVVRQTAQMIQDALSQQGSNAACVFAMDKMCMFSIESCDSAIEKLQKTINNLVAAKEELKDGNKTYVTVNSGVLDKNN